MTLVYNTVALPSTRNEVDLRLLVRTHLQIEKLKQAINRQCSSLQGQDCESPYLKAVEQRAVDFEEWVEAEIKDLVIRHPAWPWLSQVKGVGPENAGKLIAFIGDIARFATVSKLWKYAGYNVEEGRAPRKAKGEKTTWNQDLRAMCWRLGVSLIQASGAYYRYYLEVKEEYRRRYRGSIVSARKGNAAPPGKVTAKHIHNMALRRMIKLFLSHLWEKWRQAEGLPVRGPYAVDRLGYPTAIEPFIG